MINVLLEDSALAEDHVEEHGVFMEPIVPNPAHGVVSIDLVAATVAHVLLEVYAIHGNCKLVIADRQIEPGHHTVHLNTEDLDVGAYEIVMTLGTSRHRQQLVVIR